MKIKIKRIILMLILSIGIILDILCLAKVLNYKMYIYPVSMVAVYSIIVIFLPLFFPNLNIEKSKYIKKLTKKDKLSAISVLILIIIWIASLIPCVILSI